MSGTSMACPSLPSAASGIGWYEFMLTAPRLSNEFRFEF